MSDEPFKEEDFPSLDSVINFEDPEQGAWSVNYVYLVDIQKYLLDKQRVREVVDNAIDQYHDDVQYMKKQIHKELGL